MSDVSMEASPQSNSPLSPTLVALQQLIAVVARLRDPEGGCPWDLAQTPETLIPYVIEEAYEVVDAIQTGESADIAEELGDLLLQVVLQAQIASEAQDFDLAQVAQGITKKLIRRHPHVFGADNFNPNATSTDGVSSQRASTSISVEQVHQNWEAIKAAEKGKSVDSNRLTPKLQKYARSLPPLMAGMKISQKAAKAGFEWDNIEGVWEKFHEELDEFQQAIATESPARQQAELGDLLFTLVNLARWYDLDPSAALQETNRRFNQRFAQVEDSLERPLQDYTLAELEERWQQAKRRLADEPS